MAVATANLAQLEIALDAQGLVENAPYRDIVTAPQSYDSQAISFKIRFGYITDKRTDEQQEVWVLLYPPRKEGGHAEVQFHSGHPDTSAFVKHDDTNISLTISNLHSAFKNPKKPARNKHVALAKYYYLRALAEMETKSGHASELQIPIPITRTFAESLKLVCREFETKAREESSHMRSHSPSTMLDDDDGNLNDSRVVLSDPAQPVNLRSMLQGVPNIMVTPEMCPTLTHDTNAQQIRNLLEIRHDEEQIRSSDSAIEEELAALEAARQEIEREHRLLEQRRRINVEKKVTIAARRENLFKGMSIMDAFKLGGEIERSYADKRRKLA